MTTGVCPSCGAQRASAGSVPCPNCGERQLVRVQSERVSVTESMSLWQERRESLARRPWLRPTMLALNIAALFAGLAISQGAGFLVGAVLLVLNEVLTPVVVHRIVTRTHLGGSVRPVGELNTAKLGAQAVGDAVMKPTGDLQAVKLPRLEDELREPHGEV